MSWLCKIGQDEHDVKEHDVEGLRDKERGNYEKEIIEEEEEEGPAKLIQRKSQQNSWSTWEEKENESVELGKVMRST